MQPSFSTATRAVAAAILIAVSAQPSFAACTKLGFSVNDYGKDGPTKDAKGLLDKYIAKWAADHKIAKYRTGPKDVKCELFLNLIVFDEHTCRAEATVCWDGAPVTPAIKAEGTPDAKPAAAPNAPAVKRAIAPAASPAAPAAAPAKPAAAPVKPAAKASATPVVAPLETGTLPAVLKPAVPAPAAAAPTVPKPAAAEPAVADQALVAAQKAAAAAERAAAAAERAAAAAQSAERASAPAATKP
ncbi:MAG: hypothetical protein ABL901_12315 [Hyphomicrobiaceae bacterium]